jgi:hypothetical protein
MWSVRAHEVENVFRCETHFHKWGRMQGMKPNDSQMYFHWELHGVGVANVQSLERQISTKLGPRVTIKKVLKCRCSKCPPIIHLDLIGMNYDQKKERELN